MTLAWFFGFMIGCGFTWLLESDRRADVRRRIEQSLASWVVYRDQRQKKARKNDGFDEYAVSLHDTEARLAGYFIDSLESILGDKDARP